MATPSRVEQGMVDFQTAFKYIFSFSPLPHAEPSQIFLLHVGLISSVAHAYVFAGEHWGYHERDPSETTMDLTLFSREVIFPLLSPVSRNPWLRKHTMLWLLEVVPVATLRQSELRNWG
jgi:hypothetical protein